MGDNRREQLSKAIKALLAAKNEAIIYFTRRNLLEEDAGPIDPVWELAEPKKILRRQSAGGFWEGPRRETPVYPADHFRLVATFKNYRTLIERYGFTREYAPIEKAAGYLLTFQTGEGDIRGFIGNQYAPYYTGYVLSLLLRAGYTGDARIEKGMEWLLKMRQDDGGWAVPITTHYFDGKTMYRLTSSYAEPVEPDRSQPFSHFCTDMALRAFAAHPVYRQSEEGRAAGKLLKSRFFQPDVYSSYQAASYWTRFLFWWPNLLTAMESLSALGFPADNPDIGRGLDWFFRNQKEDGLWDCSYDSKHAIPKSTHAAERAWLGLRICRLLKRFPG
jgi:hypothetical protein